MDNQTIKLYVCSSSGASVSGCTGTQYCSASGSSNLSCIFNSEIDSNLHTWFAYIFDSLNESATANPLTGSYTTDSSGPVITIIFPTNTTYTTTNVSIEISTSENSLYSEYSLDGGANVSMTNVSATSFIGTLINLSYSSHTILFTANDSYGNYGVSTVRYFVVIPLPDITPPNLIIISPENLSYTSPSGTYVNVSSNEALSSAFYKLNGGSLTSLTNSSTTNWHIKFNFFSPRNKLYFSYLWK